jgi:hypothetical protein
MVKKKGYKSDDADDDQPRAPEVQDVLAFTNNVEEARATGVNEKGKEFIKIIQHIIMLCGFPEDSLMVEVIKQERWTKLEDIILIAVDEVKDLRLLRGDGMHLRCPMMVHIRIFNAFLLYYKRRRRDHTYPPDEEDVLEYTKLVFNEYCRSDQYTEDVSTVGLSSTNMAKTDPQTYSSQGNSLTVQEFRRGVKRDKAHYENLRDDKYFNSWNRGFVATARMHHIDLVLNEKYVPKNDDEEVLFKEMQIFMYTVFEEHLITSKGKSLVSHYEETHDSQSIYRELKKHALSSTAAQLSGDTLLQYITTTRYPGNGRGASYEFVLHWKEQVMKYERL